MKRLLQFKNEDGSTFFVEVDDLITNEPTRGILDDQNSRGLIQNATESFEKALKPLKEISNNICNSIRQITYNPDEVQIELGLKFSAKAGIILTSLDGEANLKIILSWKEQGVRNKNSVEEDAKGSS
jgi:hypothetical protein